MNKIMCIYIDIYVYMYITIDILIIYIYIYYIYNYIYVLNHMIHPSILKASKHPDPAFIRKACPRCWAVAAEEPSLSVFSGGFGGSILIG
jgi:hypothetical protein